MKMTLGVVAVLTMTAVASADFMEFQDVRIPDYEPAMGELAIFYRAETVMEDPDPTYEGFGRASRVFFKLDSSNNRGTLARDMTPEGWVDVQAGFWDLTLDGVNCECFGLGGAYWHLDEFFVEDSIRLVNTADESFMEVRTPMNDGTVMTMRQDVAWGDVVYGVPEPSGWAFALIALGLGLIWRF